MVVADMGVGDVGDNHTVIELSIGELPLEEALAETFRLGVGILD